MNRTVTEIMLSDKKNLIDADHNLQAKVEVTNDGITIGFNGHGTKDTYSGAPVYIEYHDGEVRVHIWTDINDPNPTTTTLAAARESARIDPEPWFRVYPDKSVVAVLLDEPATARPGHYFAYDEMGNRIKVDLQRVIKDTRDATEEEKDYYKGELQDMGLLW